MTLRVTLNELVEQVRNECGISTNSSRGLDHRDKLVQKIRRHYYMLAEDFDWEHLILKRDDTIARKEMAAGQRYYDFPTTLNPQKITQAWVRWGAEWMKVTYGLDFYDYSVLDSDDTDNRSDPVEKWRYYGHNQFEVWPIPATDYSASNGYHVAFDGQKLVERLTSDTSRADIDDILIVMSVCAELKAKSDPDEAKLFLNSFNTRMTTLRGNLASKKRITMGRGVVGEPMRGWPRYPTQIR